MQGHFPLGHGRVCQAKHLTSANQAIPDWFKIPLLGESKLIMSWFGDVGLSISDSILGLLSGF